jgi:ribosomal protein S12 methylthiotransferase
LRDAGGLAPGDLVTVQVEDSDEHDLYGVPERPLLVPFRS